MSLHQCNSAQAGEIPTRNDGVWGTLAPPCFNFALCKERAAVEKRGRAVCRRCAAALTGREYPLRAPSKRNIYRSVIEAVEAKSPTAPPADPAAIVLPATFNPPFCPGPPAT
jgi:hypothetical protein